LGANSQFWFLGRMTEYIDTKIPSNKISVFLTNYHLVNDYNLLLIIKFLLTFITFAKTNEKKTITHRLGLVLAAFCYLAKEGLMLLF
jgi:hypothetical protein